MNSQEVIDPVCEKLAKDGIEPERKIDCYDELPELEAPSGLEEVAQAAYAIHAIGRILRGHLREASDSSAILDDYLYRPLTEYAHEGLLCGIECLAGLIQETLSKKKDVLTTRRFP